MTALPAMMQHTTLNGYLRKFTEDSSAYKKQYNLYAQVIENDIKTRTFLTGKWTSKSDTVPDLTVDESSEGKDSDIIVGAVPTRGGTDEKLSIVGLTNVEIAHFINLLNGGVKSAESQGINTNTQKLQTELVSSSLIKPMYGEQSLSELGL